MLKSNMNAPKMERKQFFILYVGSAAEPAAVNSDASDAKVLN